MQKFFNNSGKMIMIAIYVSVEINIFLEALCVKASINAQQFNSQSKQSNKQPL